MSEGRQLRSTTRAARRSIGSGLTSIVPTSSFSFSSSFSSSSSSSSSFSSSSSSSSSDSSSSSSDSSSSLSSSTLTSASSLDVASLSKTKRPRRSTTSSLTTTSSTSTYDTAPAVTGVGTPKTTSDEVVCVSNIWLEILHAGTDFHILYTDDSKHKTGDRHRPLVYLSQNHGRPPWTTCSVAVAGGGSGSGSGRGPNRYWGPHETRWLIDIEPKLNTYWRAIRVAHGGMTWPVRLDKLVNDRVLTADDALTAIKASIELTNVYGDPVDKRVVEMARTFYVTWTTQSALLAYSFSSSSSSPTAPLPGIGGGGSGGTDD